MRDGFDMVVGLAAVSMTPFKAVYLADVDAIIDGLLLPSEGRLLTVCPVG